MRHLMSTACLLALSAGPAESQASRPPAYYNPAWAPDASTIAFESNREGKFAIYTVGRDGSGLRRLTTPDADAEQPSWSPDGHRIVFSWDKNGLRQLYLMNRDGTDPRPIPNTPLGFYATFSPDGKTILFGAQDKPRSPHYRILVVRPDGSGLRELGDSAKSNEGPRWSRDGKHVIYTEVPLLERLPNEAPKDFVKRRDAQQRTFSIAPDNTEKQPISQDEAHRLASDPELSSDGKWRAFTSGHADSAGVFVTDVMLHQTRRVVAAAQPPTALDDVAKAMGGKERVLAVRTLIVEGTGERLFFDQALSPYAKTNNTLTAFRRSYDFANRRLLQDETRESRYVTPMPPPLRVRGGVDGDVGYLVVGDGPMTRTSAAVAADRSAEFVYHPIGFVRAAYSPGARVTETIDGSTRRIRLDAGTTSFTMDLDSRTSLPTRISRVVDHVMLGDVTLEVELSEWRDVAGLIVPMRIVQREDRWVLSDLRLTSVRADEDPGNLAATDSVRASNPVVQAGEPAIAVNVQEIARGVWLLSGPQFNGGVYYTVAVEQSESILLVEAPENDARTLAVIAKARELRPGKPIGQLVNTHHHFDHAGGVRAAISEGLPILTHDANADFMETVVYRRRHTIRPDALERNPKPLKLIAVRDKLVLRDSIRTVELYEATGSQHSASILLVYLPAERMLIHADLETPVLVENVERLGLRVGTLVGLHEVPGPWPPR